jgi:paraquat-inducible protein B
MTEQADLDQIPQATVVPRRPGRISIVWIIPLLAAVVAIGIAVQRILSEGPTISITFNAAEGIEAGKTTIKYKDVVIGQVTDVALTEDFTKVKVTARIPKYASSLMVADARFWIVEPRISLSGVSGLGTLLSGNYIGFDAGKSDKSERNFTGLDTPPFVPGQKGRSFVLKSDSLGSLGVGSPIYYRRFNVGQISSYNLAADGRSVEIRVFVKSPYDQYVAPETRFWNASGVDLSLTADGLDLRTESLLAVLAGGLTFDTPPFLAPTGAAPENSAFTLFPDRTTAMQQPNELQHKYVLFFDEPIRGLAVGAPVTFRGLEAGVVTDVGLSFNNTTLEFRPRVLITFYPERLIARVESGQRSKVEQALGGMSNAARIDLIKRTVEERGLRGQLQTGNLLTGAKYIAFDYHPGAPRVKIDWNADPMELPVMVGGLGDIEAKLASILAKIDSMPLKEIGVDLKDTIASLNTAVKNADELIQRVDAEWVPEGTKALEDLRRAIRNLDTSYLDPNQPAPADLREAIQEATRAARSVRILTDYLERHPEVLIRGKPEEKP